jgi:hypothetical protein
MIRVVHVLGVHVHEMARVMVVAIVVTAMRPAAITLRARAARRAEEGCITW